MTEKIIWNLERNVFVEVDKIRSVEVSRVIFFWEADPENKGAEVFQVIGHLKPKGLFYFGGFGDSKEEAEAFKEELEKFVREDC